MTEEAPFPLQQLCSAMPDDNIIHAIAPL